MAGTLAINEGYFPIISKCYSIHINKMLLGNYAIKVYMFIQPFIVFLKGLYRDRAYNTKLINY